MRIIRVFAAVLAGIGGICTILMMLQIVLDVLWRWIFNHPIGGTVEIVSNYYLVLLTFLPLAMVQLADQHIAVNLFVQLLPSRIRKWLAYLMMTIAFFFSAWLTWASLIEAIASFRMGEVIETAASVMSIWPSRFVVVVGIGFMAFVLAAQIFSRTENADESLSDIGVGND